MNETTIRSLYWLGILAGVVLFILMLWDYWGNDSDWFIGLVIAFAVVILGLVLLLLARSDEDDAPPAAPLPVAVPAAAPEAYYDYKGDVHDVIDIEGIGPIYAEKLQAQGIYTTARLCYEDAADVANRIGAPVKTVRAWQAMSELAKVNGIGKQYAEALVRAGLTGIQDLKDRKAARIADQVNAYLDTLEVNVLGQKVTEKRVLGWQKKAKPMRRVRQPVPEA